MTTLREMVPEFIDAVRCQDSQRIEAATRWLSSHGGLKAMDLVMLVQQAERRLIPRKTDTIVATPNPLSVRECDILQGVSQGMSSPVIAKLLHLSVPTVKTYMLRIFDKLGVRDRTAAVVVALRNGWIDGLEAAEFNAFQAGPAAGVGVLMIIDGDGIIRVCDGPHLMGQPEDYVGKALLDITLKPDLPYIEAALAGNPVRYINEYQGERFDCRYHPQRDANGDLVGIVATYTIVSAVKVALSDAYRSSGPAVAVMALTAASTAGFSQSMRMVGVNI